MDLASDVLVPHPRLGHRVQHPLYDLANDTGWEGIKIGERRWARGAYVLGDHGLPG
jgi:hypothetical protein